MRINFESKPVYGDHDNYIKTKIKVYAGSIITKEKAPCKYLSLIMIDSVLKAKYQYYPQTLLEECKYIQEKIKIQNYINKDLEDSKSDDSSIHETGSDIHNEEKFVKK